MFDTIAILTFSGVVLWETNYTRLNTTQIINNVIENVMLENRIGAKEYVTNDCKVNWNVRSRERVIIFSISPRFAIVENVQVFLRKVITRFCEYYGKQLSERSFFEEPFDFDEQYEKLLKSLGHHVHHNVKTKENGTSEEDEELSSSEENSSETNRELISSDEICAENISVNKSMKLQKMESPELYASHSNENVEVRIGNEKGANRADVNTLETYSKTEPNYDTSELPSTSERTKIKIQIKEVQVGGNVLITKDGRKLKIRGRGNQTKHNNNNATLKNQLDSSEQNSGGGNGGNGGGSNNKFHNNILENSKAKSKRKKPGKPSTFLTGDGNDDENNNSNNDNYEKLAKLSTRPPTANELRAQTELQRAIYVKRLPNGVAAPVETSKWEVEQRGRLANWLRSYIGKREIDAQDLSNVIPNLREKLITKNVAVEVTEHICKSVESSLKGIKLGTFDSLQHTVEMAMVGALQRIMQPKHEVNILRDVSISKSRGRPYSIVFCGVNGVGKSTSLAKVAYWLKENGYSVMLAAGDTFRHGAVEQLQVHGRCLDCPVFQMGYGTDPSAVTSAALSQATREHIDVVMIDTAGRMQDHESRMRALAKLIHDNTPELVLFVGEALVGNNGIDQLRKFNRCLIDYAPVETTSHGIDGIVLTKFDTIDDKVGAALTMVYELGQPIVFVGVGQTYQDLKTVDPNVIVNALMK